VEVFRGRGIGEEGLPSRDPATAFAGHVLERADRAAEAVTRKISLAEAVRRVEAGKLELDSDQG
jgi:hypothetical protein